MDTLSATEAARRLGTSVPRVQRAIRRLGLPVARGRGGRVQLTEPQLEV
jgi:excisionase family DNA binding protein